MEWAVYLGALIVVPCCMLLVSGGAMFRADNRPLMFVQEDYIKNMENSNSVSTQISAVLLKQVSTPAGLVLTIAALLAYGYLLVETFRLDTGGARSHGRRSHPVFFCMLFFAFFEQGGSSINNFTDRNVSRVFCGKDAKVISPSDVGKNIALEPTQEQLGYHNDGELFTLDKLAALREKNTGQFDFRIEWKVAPDNVGMKIARRSEEIAASTFQAVNPIYILLLGLVFSALWTFLGTHGLEPSTPFKFALGLLQLGRLCCASGTAPGGECSWNGRRRVAAAGLPSAHDGRTVPLARRAVDDYKAFTRPTGQHGDGRVVPDDRDCPVLGWHDRSVYKGRRQRRCVKGHSASVRFGPHLWKRLWHHCHSFRYRGGSLFLPRAIAEAMDARRRRRCWVSDFARAAKNTDEDPRLRAGYCRPAGSVPPPLAFGQVELDAFAEFARLCPCRRAAVVGLQGFGGLDLHAAADGRHQRVALPDGVDRRFDRLGMS